LALLIGTNSKNYDFRVDSLALFTDLSKIYKKYDDYYGNLYLGTKAMLNEDGLIRGNRLVLGLWDEDSPYSFLNKKEQEIQYVSDMISDVENGKIDSIQLIEKQNKFKAVYPTSNYISVLNTLKPTISKDYILAQYSEKDGFREFGALKVDDLTRLTGMFLGGGPVFLDFWATWCGPCLNEFNYRSELEPFLKENNIGVMYVSLDYGGNYEKWKKTIIEKKLEGFHYLATPELGEQLPYFKESNAIPRYILIDKGGNIIINKCEYPSTGKLIPQIKAELNL
jgi:thiol-disulfide isomerase/thioredoxin